VPRSCALSLFRSLLYSNVSKWKESRFLPDSFSFKFLCARQGWTRNHASSVQRRPKCWNKVIMFCLSVSPSNDQIGKLLYACAVWECLTHLKITAPSPTVLYCSLSFLQCLISSCFDAADLSKDLRRAFCACPKIISDSLVTQIEIFSVQLASDVPHSTRMY
jgi:hypothetical protein